MSKSAAFGTVIEGGFGICLGCMPTMWRLFAEHPNRSARCRAIAHHFSSTLSASKPEMTIEEFLVDTILTQTMKCPVKILSQ